jgi:hypothetical protein
MIKYGAFDVDGSFTRVYGEKGVCEMSGKFIGREKGTQPRQLDMQRGDSTQEAFNDFFRGIREGKQPYCGIEIGKTALLTTLLGRKALFEEKVVSWEDLLREDASQKRVGDTKFGPIA